MQWTQLIRHAWRGILDPRQSCQYLVVRPEPPCNPEDPHVAHLILMQRPQPHERAALLSAVYYTPPHVAIQHLARIVPDTLSLTDAIDLVEVPRSVQHRRITGMIGWRPLLDPPHPPLEVTDGTNVRVNVYPPPEESSGQDFAFLWAQDDDRSRSPRRDHVDTDETSFMARQDAGPPRSLREPQDSPDDHAAISSSDPDAVSTYDSDHPSQFFHIFRLQAPMVAARVRSDDWAMMISNIQSVLKMPRHQFQQLHVVTHLPHDLRGASTYVALIQRHLELVPGDTRRYILVDIVFHEHDRVQTNTHRSAQLLPGQLTRQQILAQLHVDLYCSLPGVRRRCLVRHNHRRIPLQDITLHQLEHADYIRIDLPPIAGANTPTRYVALGLRQGLTISQIRGRYPHDPEPVHEWETVTASSETELSDLCDDMSLLQQRKVVVRPTVGSVAHDQRPTTLSLDELIPIPKRIQIDFSNVVWTRHLLHSLTLPICSPLPMDLEFLPSTLEAIESLIPLPVDVLPTKFHFYVDGSKFHEGQVGAAVLLLCEFPHGLAYGGHLCSKVDHASHAHLGEHAAMTWALLWAQQCSAWLITEKPIASIEFCFHYDATVTGNQAAGRWQTLHYKNWRTFMRSLVHILQHRHGHRALIWEHVKAHNNHPWK